MCTTGLSMRKHTIMNEHTGKNLSQREIQDRLVASKKSDKPWLTEVNSQTLLASLANLDGAFRNFFAGRAKYPTPKKKYSGWQSFQCPQHAQVDFDRSIIDLPKIKGIKAVLHRKFDGKIKTVTIKRTPTNKYQVSVLVDDGIEENTAPDVISSERTMGIDVGLSHFLISSEGDKVDNPGFLQNALLLLGKEQKKLSRKKQSSANRSKQKKRVACIHEGIAIKREAFIHEKTAELAVKNHATTFVVENLNINGMVKNHKLARHIQDVSWGTFLRVLDYKCQWNSKNLIKIDRFFPSSKQCHACLYKADKMPLSIREWTCSVCGANHDRDINAAINIRNKGLADSLGHSDCIKSSPVAIPVSAGATARGISI